MMDLLIVIIVALLLAAFFSGLETSFISANKLHFELDKKQHIFPFNILNIFSKNPSQFITTVLICSTLALVIYGLVIAHLIEPTNQLFTHANSAVLLIQILIATIIFVMLAEFLPKKLFKINPNKKLRIFAVPVFLFYLMFYPIANFSIIISRRFIKLVLGKNNIIHNATFGNVDLDYLANETQVKDHDIQAMVNDVKIFQNALDFSNVKLRECVVPRPEVVAVAIDDTVEFLKQRFIETGYSKILVYENSIDNIIGFATSMQLFKKPNSIKEMVQNLPIVPESMAANKLLSLFIQNRKSMALVVDEFGGTSGIVTMEDILEEIVGDIQDEHDQVKLIDQRVSDTEFKFSGRLEIDNLNEKYKFNLPISDEYETIAGLLLAHYGSIPKVNDVVLIGGFSFKIIKATTTKIELVQLKIAK